MLYYLIAVTRDLTNAAILMGLLYAHLPAVCGNRGKRMLGAGVVAGLAVAALMAVLRNTTKIMDRTGGTGMWNVRIFALSTVALLVYYVCGAKPVLRKTGVKGGIAAGVAAGVLVFTFLVYAMPGVMAYPFNFSLNGESVLSTTFLYRFIGYLCGLLLCALVCLASYQTAKWIEGGTAKALVNAVLFINGFQQVTKAISVLHGRRIITSQALFNLVRYTSNYSDLFTYAVMAAAFLTAIILWVRSFRVNEPYENPAQRRKIRAKWRAIRRWSAALVLCFVMVVVNMTALTAIENREVELSPTEDCEVRGGNVYVPLGQVDDGHLHRFAYLSDTGAAIRFIIIQKPNSSAYGIGLDACEICGETGYYERNGQVICNLCDVVMNINTIGFKGGCNPIPIDYSIEGGYIIIPTHTLLEHEKTFA